MHRESEFPTEWSIPAAREEDQPQDEPAGGPATAAPATPVEEVPGCAPDAFPRGYYYA